MKYIKLFEFENGKTHDLFSQARFKVGDYVRTKNNTGLFDDELKPGHNYFIIKDINTHYGCYNFLLHNIISPGDMDFYDQGSNLELVPEYEITAIKYNL
jgi:hypothetical protein